ncbi:MAG TPA: sugar phosphate isomerase/epimerase family protein [Planctomycetota bacterium]|nr:sugar phosphate isomerase/epimerase family protein [Planctomycetota bacterium]
MFFSGIADEAATSIERQVEAHRALGWRHIELRLIDGTNVVDLDDSAFDRVADRVRSAGLEVSCFAARLANWGRPIDTDFAVDRDELVRNIPRMQRLGTRFIRCMSYPNAKPPLPVAEWRKRVVDRMRELAKIAEDGGVVLVHENCDGWGGLGPRETMELLAEVDSPALKLVFDTGNPVAHRQDAWEYYPGVRDEIVYVHIKDYRRGDDGKEVACYAGEGEGRVRDIISDLLERGYDGGFSIEPHITSVVHLAQAADDPELAYATYVEYGKRLMALVESIRSELKR